MKERPWYKRYGGDFVMGTMGLTLEERGAYSLLIDLMHDRGGPLPDDAKYFSNIMGVSAKRWKIIRGRLIEAGKIDERDGFLTQKRVEKDLENTSKIKEIRSQAGSEGGKKSGAVRNKNNEVDKASASNDAKQTKSKNAVRAHKPEARDQNNPHTPLNPDDPAARAVVDGFLNWREKFWPNWPNLPSPTMTLETQARAYLADGADGQTIIAAFAKRMKAMAEVGEPAPTNLGFVRLSVQSAAAKANAEAPPAQSYAETERATRHARLKNLIAHSVWKDEWGDLPAIDDAKAELERLGL